MCPRGLRRHLADRNLLCVTRDSRALNPGLLLEPLHRQSNMHLPYQRQRALAHQCGKRTHLAMFWIVPTMDATNLSPQNPSQEMRSLSRHIAQRKSEVNAENRSQESLVLGPLLAAACQNVQARAIQSRCHLHVARPRQARLPLLSQNGFACSRPRNCASDCRTSNATLTARLKTFRTS